MTYSMRKMDFKVPLKSSIREVRAAWCLPWLFMSLQAGRDTGTQHSALKNAFNPDVYKPVSEMYAQ